MFEVGETRFVRLKESRNSWKLHLSALTMRFLLSSKIRSLRVKIFHAVAGETTRSPLTTSRKPDQKFRALEEFDTRLRVAPQRSGETRDQGSR